MNFLRDVEIIKTMKHGFSAVKLNYKICIKLFNIAVIFLLCVLFSFADCLCVHAAAIFASSDIRLHW